MLLLPVAFPATVPESPGTASEEQLKPFFANINVKADTILLYALLGYFGFGLLLALFYDTWLIALGVGTCCLLAYFVAKALLPKTSFYRYVASGTLAVFTAQFIYQMHGLFEMHFIVFLSAALLIGYQEWRLQLPLMLLVVAHHAGFAYLQYAGYQQVYFTQLDYMSLQAFLFHTLLASAISFACGGWSYQARRHTLESAWATLLLQQQVKNTQRGIVFANAISQGQLQESYERTQGDELGAALLNMQQSLQQAAGKDAQERFVNTGLTQVNELIRKHNANLEELSGKMITLLVKHLGANQGGFFVLEGESEQDQHLSLKGCYAYNRLKHLSKRIEIGEGLLGQMYLGKEIVHLTEIPPGYLAITSGLGEAPPCSILLVPLMLNEQVVGGIELAGFHPFSPEHFQFLEKAGETIASSILSAKTAARTQLLLEQFQQATNQLQAQEEEKRQNLEQLEATQEQMRRNEQEYLSRIAQSKGED